MALQTTRSSAAAWSPDIVEYLPSDVLAPALIFRASTVVTEALTGDAPAARIPWVRTDGASYVGEGDEIPESEDELDETVIRTTKVSKLVTLSREQYSQHHTPTLISESVSRAVVHSLNVGFIRSTGESSNPEAPTPLGIINTDGIIEGETITDDLDPLSDVVGQIENNGGTPTLIVANPLAWSALRRLKVGADRNDTLLGSGTADQERKLLGVEAVTSPAVPENEIVVLDATAIPSAVGPLEVATSDQFLFNRDSIALRCTIRAGWALQAPDRIARLTVNAGGSAEG